MRVMRVDNRLATPRHAQTSGQVERANSIIKRRLISAITADGSRWEEALPLATLAINCNVQRTTGTSPFQANFFREPRVPQTLAGPGYTPTRVTQRQVTDILETVRENVLSAADAMKQRQDRQRTGRTYKVGDKVWVSARVFSGQSGPPKLHCAFYGPYEVTQQINANAYRLAGLPAGIHPTQNVSELRPFEASPERFSTRPRQPIPKPVTVDGEEEWEVEKILAYRHRGAIIEFKVKWKDSPQTSWVSRDDLRNAPRLLKRFEDAHGLTTQPTPRRAGLRTRASA